MDSTCSRDQSWHGPWSIPPLSKTASREDRSWGKHSMRGGARRPRRPRQGKGEDRAQGPCPHLTVPPLASPPPSSPLPTLEGPLPISTGCLKHLA